MASCVTAGEEGSSSIPAADTTTTRPETPGSSPARGDDRAEAPPNESDPEAEPSTSSCPERSGLLAVTGVDGEVTVVDPDGTLVRELRGPVGPGNPGPQPTWSPICGDGGPLIAWTEADEGRAFLIAVADANTGDIRRHAVPLAPFYYYWSPDAHLLAFLGQNPFSPLEMGVLTLSTEEVEIVGEGQPFYFDWHRDSDAMVAHVGDDLLFLTLRGGAWTSRAIPLTPGLFQAPAWVAPERILLVAPSSPKMVEVVRRGPSTQGDVPEQRLIVSDRDGTPVRNLAELEGAAAFTPDPDGQRVAFTDFDGPLRVLDLDRVEPEVVVSERRVAAFQWSPGGDHLLFMEVDPDARALVPRVWDGNRTLTFPSFFPTQVFLLQYLPFWDQYSRSLTLWSPDGKAFTYPAASPDGDRIMVQHLDQRRPTEVAEGVFASWSPSRR